MVKSDYFLSPQEYLEIVTGKTFIISGDNDCEYIERQLMISRNHEWSCQQNSGIVL